MGYVVTKALERYAAEMVEEPQAKPSPKSTAKNNGNKRNGTRSSGARSSAKPGGRVPAKKTARKLVKR
jgi:hypothetical protein